MEILLLMSLIKMAGNREYGAHFGIMATCGVRPIMWITKKNGLEIIFYDSPDCPESEAYYKNDSLHGLRIQYSKRCKKYLEEYFVHGKKEGWEIGYYDNCMKKAEGYYRMEPWMAFTKYMIKKDALLTKPGLYARIMI